MDYYSNYINKLLPKRPKESHKGIFGHVLNIAGSEFYSGAAYFSSISALKVGCGLSTLASTDEVLSSVAALSPDIILMPLDRLNKEIIEKYQTVSIGCGLSTENKAVNTFKKMLNLLEKSAIPVVIDADGLNILSMLKDIELPPNLILTPHPKEMARLMGTDANDIIKHSDFWAKKCSEKYNCTTVLKLHETIITDNKGDFYINNTGNSALAHGGSGDVLCGMITGFLAQGVNLFNSCCLAVYLHGLSAELAGEDLTQYCTLSSDLLNYIPKAFLKVNK